MENPRSSNIWFHELFFRSVNEFVCYVRKIHSENNHLLATIKRLSLCDNVEVPINLP